MVVRVGINGFGRIGRVIFRTCVQSKDLEVTAINDPAVDIEYICYLIKFDSTHGKFKGEVSFSNNEICIDEQKVISCASSTLYCLAPIVKILEDNYGVSEGFITSIHAMTPSLKPLDGLCLKGKHWRDHRSIHQNIIPAATGACRALGKIIPPVKDKLTGLAFRVPIVNVSVLDITVRLSKNTTIQDIIKCVEAESKSTMKNIIKISKDQEVSSDFLGDENSCIFDANSSLQLNPKFFKLICWYENEYSYACRVVDSIKYCEENHYKPKAMTKIPLGRIISSNQTVHTYPIPDFSKEYIISNCEIESNPKILRGSSQETSYKGKSSQRQVTFDKPSQIRNSGSKQLVLRENKQSNDTFKVWNDESQISRPLVKEKRNSFFQSRVTLGPSYTQNNNYEKTKERLEEVKKEFSKMVNMTENLLKKTNQSKCKIHSFDENLENEVGNKETKQEFCKTRRALPTVSKSIPTSSGFHTNISKLYKDVFKTHKKGNSNISMVKNTCVFKETDSVDSQELKENMQSRCNDPDDVKSQILDKKPQRQSDSQLVEKVNTVRVDNGLANQRNLDETLNLKTKSIVCNNNINCNEPVYKAITDIERSHLCTKKLNEHDIQNHDLKNFISPKICSDGILTNREYIQNKSASSNTELGESKITKRDEIRKKILEGIMKVLTTDALEDKTRCPSLVNTNTTISNGEANKGLDIYDKIDSASGTDSENSFQLNEKTSQVIDIKELTSSAEELARLDKICRIIEISDEMSDKLFSALDNNDGIRKEKWSFKDLCERLKLDEFCNKVFGSQN